jgi:hypothetical protein
VRILTDFLKFCQAHGNQRSQELEYSTNSGNIVPKKTTYAKLLSIGIAQKHPTCTSISRGETGSVRTSETTNLVGVWPNGRPKDLLSFYK